MRFTINNLHPAFSEVAETLLHGLRAIGHGAEIQTNEFSDTPIILGAVYLPPKTVLPTNAIIYNLEQYPNIVGYKLNQFAHHLIWDYSRPNLEHWKNFGGEAVHVPIGYMPQLTHCRNAEKDIDVFFSGGCTGEHRTRIFDGLRRDGVQVFKVSNLFGQSRDIVASRARIVLNLHYWDNYRNFEIVRIAPALANKSAILTEDSVDDADYGWLNGGIVNVPYEQVIGECKALLGNRARLEALAESGFEKFSQQDERDFLKRALDETKWR